MRDRADLILWLRGQSSLTAAIVASRAALRVLPASMVIRNGGYLQPRFGNFIWQNVRLFGCLRSLSAVDPRANAEATSRYAASIAEMARSFADSASLAPRNAGFATLQAAIAVENAAAHAEHDRLIEAARVYNDNEMIARREARQQKGFDDAMTAAGRAASYVAAASWDSAGTEASSTAWSALSADTVMVEQSGGAAGLLGLPLWAETPSWVLLEWERGRQALLASPEGYAIWVDWFERRLRGTRFAFEFPNEVAEEEFYRRFLGRPEPWWSMPVARINSAVEELVQSLSGEPAEPDEQSLKQNPLALTFRQSESGQIGLSNASLAKTAAADLDAYDRHREVMREAEAAYNASAMGLTQATDVAVPIRDYIEALGGSPPDIRPSLLVLRGNKLRRLYECRLDNGSLLPPLSQDQQDALASLITAHNLLVAFDPYLTQVEQATYGPDASQILVPVSGMRIVIESLQTAGLPTEDAGRSLEEAIEVIPEQSKPKDRRWLFASESLNNFVRAIGAVVKGGKKAASTLSTATKMIDWVHDNIALLDRVFASSARVRDILDWIARLK